MAPPIPIPRGGDDSEVYTLHPLLYPALPSPHPSRVNPTSPAGVSLAVRCAAGHGRNLYVGSSDGVVHHYVLRDEGSSSHPNQYSLVSSKPLSSSPSNPIERILVLHRIGLAAVVADGTLSFFHLPNLDPLPPQTLPTVRGVVTVVLDDAEVDAGGVDGEGYVSLCVLKRRGAVLAKVGMGQWIPIKDVPTPRGTVLAGRRGDTLCTATTTEYSLVNLSTSTIVPLGLPISHSSSSPSASTRPSIVSIPGRTDADECEFLITSHSDSQTLGVFVRANGEPAAKLIEWDSHPRALAVVHPHLVALLRDDAMQIYEMQQGDDQAGGQDVITKAQTIHLPGPLEPRLLAAGPSSLHVVTASAKVGDLVVRIDPAERRQPGDKGEANNDDDGDHALPQADFTAARHHSAWRTAILHTKDQHAKILMTCRNAVQSLVQPVPLADALPLIEQGRWVQLELYLDEVWRTYSDQPSTAATLRNIYALIAFRHLCTLDFYAATTPFMRSSLDIRFLLRLFPDLNHSDSPSSVESPATVFAALEGIATAWQPIDEMIRHNLVFNYAPHLRLDDDPHLQELAGILTRRAGDMLETVLLHVRQGNEGDVRADAPTRAATDTALAKLYAQRKDTPRLSALLLDITNACDTAAIEGPARETSALAPLARLFAQRKEWEKAFDIWTQLIDAGEAAGSGDGGDGGDDGIPSVDQLAHMLQDCGLPHVQKRYALWLVKHDAKAGVELLIRPGTDIAAVDASDADRHPSAIVRQLREAGADTAAEEYIEQVVLSRASTTSSGKTASKGSSTNLDQDLVDLLFARLESAVASDSDAPGVFVELAQSYVQGGYAEPIISHLAVHASGPSPSATALVNRLKLAMLLQGSNSYDTQAALDRIEAVAAHSVNLALALAYERAILLGKLGQDEAALRLLALSLHDAASAEAYCTQAGVILSPFVAEQLAVTASAEDKPAEGDTLRAYAALVARGVRAATRAKAKAQGGKALKGKKWHEVVDEGEKSRLLKALLRVYMAESGDGGESDTPASPRLRTATAHLLNTQFAAAYPALTTPDAAKSGDSSTPAPAPSALSEILPMVPPHWPLSTLSTFLVRSLRRESHARHQGAIERGVCLSRSLEVGEESWRKVRALGGVIQEAEEEGEEDGDDERGGGDAQEEAEGSVEETFAPKEKEKDVLSLPLLGSSQDTHADLAGDLNIDVAGVGTFGTEKALPSLGYDLGEARQESGGGDRDVGPL